MTPPPDDKDQVTLRLPRELATALRRKAREKGVTKSQVVREALAAYLAVSDAEPDAAWERITPFIGAVRLDPAAVEQDALVRQIRDHNWRQ